MTFFSSFCYCCVLRLFFHSNCVDYMYFFLKRFFFFYYKISNSIKGVDCCAKMRWLQINFIISLKFYRVNFLENKKKTKTHKRNTLLSKFIQLSFVCSILCTKFTIFCYLFNIDVYIYTHNFSMYLSVF